jgi:hypothetical protein
MCNHCLAHNELRKSLETIVNIAKKEIKEKEEQDKKLYELCKFCNELIDEIPGGYSDGTGICSPLGWIKWAKKQLGYI